MKKSRLNIFKQRKLIALFIAETTAEIAAKITHINRKSSIYYFYRLRKLIFEKTTLKRDEIFKGKVELDKSYFVRVRKGKRGRGAAGKVPVFGILKRGEKVYAEMILDTKRYFSAY